MEKPTTAQQQKVLDHLYFRMIDLRKAIADAEENAAYAETLGLDLAREANHVVHLQKARLQGLLVAVDLLGWSMGFKTKHAEEVSELEKLIQAELPHWKS